MDTDSRAGEGMFWGVEAAGERSLGGGGGEDLCNTFNSKEFNFFLKKWPWDTEKKEKRRTDA